MPCLVNLFTPAELEKLDAKQLQLLDEIIMSEIQNELVKVRKQLRKKLKPKVYDRWVAQNARKARPGRKRRRSRSKRKS